MWRKIMIKYLLVAVVSYGFLFSGLVSAASFDCAKASSPYEKAVCSNANLSSLDDQLALVYKDARAKSADPEGLKKDQIEWIKSTRQCSNDIGCIEKAYRTRITNLSAPTTANTVQPAQPPSKPVSQKDQYQAMVTRSINELGPNGYANCAVATLTMVAKEARGDNLGRFKSQVEPMSNFMGAVRAGLISRGTPEAVLDRLFRSSSQIIMSDADPDLRAMKEFDKCYKDAIR